MNSRRKATSAWPAQPGRYFFTDAIGAPPERIEVVDDDGELCARFIDSEGKVDLLLVANMSGTWSMER